MKGDSADVPLLDLGNPHAINPPTGESLKPTSCCAALNYSCSKYGRRCCGAPPQANELNELALGWPAEATRVAELELLPYERSMTAGMALRLKKMRRYGTDLLWWSTFFHYVGVLCGLVAPILVGFMDDELFDTERRFQMRIASIILAILAIVFTAGDRAFSGRERGRVILLAVSKIQHQFDNFCAGSGAYGPKHRETKRHGTAPERVQLQPGAQTPREYTSAAAADRGDAATEAVLAAVTIDLDKADADKAALEARIITLTHERQQLEAGLDRKLAPGPNPEHFHPDPKHLHSGANFRRFMNKYGKLKEEAWLATLDDQDSDDQ